MSLPGRTVIAFLNSMDRSRAFCRLPGSFQVDVRLGEERGMFFALLGFRDAVQSVVNCRGGILIVEKRIWCACILAALTGNLHLSA